jgi:hypothetical protein
MMKNNLIFKGLVVLLLMGAFQASVLAAPACKGQKKNDPGCDQEAAAAPVVVDSVTVDWLNEKLVVRGSGLAGATNFVLGNSVSLGVASVTDTELDIPFNLDMADEVLSQGNYNLKVDGAVQLSVFIESQIIDPGDTGCPCQADWTLEPAVKWGIPSADCLEIEGPFSNDIADISGTIFSDYPVGAAYPQHPIGASFYPGEPDSSVCRLVEVNSDATTTDLVNKRINENQQATCATELKANVCATVTLFP